jgi:DNA gyrase subunit A
MRTPVSEVSELGRNTMGVIVMETEADDRVSSVEVVPGAAE